MHVHQRLLNVTLKLPHCAACRSFSLLPVAVIWYCGCGDCLSAKSLDVQHRCTILQMWFYSNDFHGEYKPKAVREQIGLHHTALPLITMSAVGTTRQHGSLKWGNENHKRKRESGATNFDGS